MDDVLKLAKLGESIKEEFQKMGMKVAQEAQAHMIEEAGKKLHSTKDKFVENLSLGEDNGVFLVVLDASVRWIDDGQKQRNLLESLLKNGKTAKDGSKYRVIPFQKNGPTSGAQGNLVNTIKSNFKDKGIPFDEIENNQDGSPKEGLLHSMDINTSNTETPHGKFSVPVGQSGNSFLQGVRVYQKKVTTPQGKQSVNRFVGTFRVASSKQQGKGLWDVRATPGAHIFEETLEWVTKQFDDKWAGELLKAVTVKIK